MKALRNSEHFTPGIVQQYLTHLSDSALNFNKLIAKEEISFWKKISGGLDAEFLLNLRFIRNISGDKYQVVWACLFKAVENQEKTKKYKEVANNICSIVATLP